eukprot:6266112-Alexandrium_andersonii.AAC.2
MPRRVQSTWRDGARTSRRSRRAEKACLRSQRPSWKSFARIGARTLIWGRPSNCLLYTSPSPRD